MIIVKATADKDLLNNLKSIMLILGFILGKLKKVTRWHCCWKILKRLIKVVITPLLSQLQGWPGWQKNGTMLRYLHLVVFCAKIEPKIEKIQKTIRKQGVFWWFFVNFDSFLKFTQFCLNSSAKTEQIYLSKKKLYFLTPSPSLNLWK